MRQAAIDGLICWLQNVLGKAVRLMRVLGMLSTRTLGILIEGNFLAEATCTRYPSQMRNTHNAFLSFLS